MPGRKLASSNYHITLHFIGNVSAEQQSCLHLAAQSVSASGVSLCLDHYGHFSKPRVLWMGCKDVPESLTQLQQRLGQALSVCGYEPEARIYTPHVTLMRKLSRPGDLPSMVGINWQSNEFVLVESTSSLEGVQYKVIEHYPLG